MRFSNSRVINSVLFGILIMSGLVEQVNAQSSQVNDAVVMSDVNAPFIPNHGQYPDAVKFVAKTFIGEVLVTEGDLTYIVPKFSDQVANEVPSDLEAVVLRETFVGAQNYSLTAGGVSAAKANFFNNSEESNFSNIVTHNEVKTSELWPGITLTLRGGYANIEKIFELQPGSDPSQIAMLFEGIQDLTLNLDGQLDLNTALGTLSFSKPVAWQEVDGEVQAVEIAYRLLDSQTYGFTLGSYNPSLPLLIDPLISATYIGGSSNTTDNLNGIARDSSGNIYAVGTSASTAWMNPPSVTPYPAPGVGIIPVNQDIVVFKLNSSLNSLTSWAVLGSAVAGSDVGNDIVVSDAGDVYVLGSCTTSFVASGGFDVTHGGGTTDICVIKLNSGLTSHIVSTYLGAAVAEVGSSIAFDNTNNRVIVLGTSAGAGYPVACTLAGACTPYQSLNGGSTDFVISVLNSDLTSNLSSTYYGGTGAETVTTSNQLVLDASGNIVFTGTTASSSLASAGAFDTSAIAGTDSIVVKFNQNLATTGRIAATYFAEVSGTTNEVGRAVQIDNDGNIFIAGTTSAAGIPITFGSFSQVYNGGTADIFVAKFNSTLTALSRSTFLGGAGVDTPNKIVFDAAGNLLVGGTTTLAIPVNPTACYSGISTANEGIVIKIGSNLTSPYSASYFGGSGTTDDINDMLISDGIIHFAGSTTSPGLFGGYDINNNTTGIDGFIARMDGDLCVAPTVTNITSSTANGTYGIGDIIPIEVTFSTVVNSLGIPTLTLETGTTDQVVNYSSGTGTDTLVFNYTVVAGDSAPDLDYLSAAALVGSVQSLGTTAAALALPTPGNTASLSNNKNIVIDGIAPSAPTVSFPVSGSSVATDVPSFSGLAEALAVVEVKNGLTVLCSDTADTFGVWSCISSSLSDAVYNLTVEATDTAGNLSAATAHTVTIDTVAPALPIITAPASGQNTNDNTPLIAGTADPLIAISVLEGMTTLCSTTANALGDWSCSSIALTDGAHVITANASDVAGNSTASGSLNFTVDTVGPVNVSISEPVDAAITNDNTPTISGLGENGASISVKEGAGTLCSTTVAGGVWSCTSSALSHGAHNIYAEATDASSNVNTTSTRAFSIDLIAPAAPVILTPANNYVTEDTTPLFTGTAEANATVTFYDGVTLIGATSVSGSGAWSFASASVLNAGSHNINVYASDAVGNISSVTTLAINIMSLSASGCSPTSIATPVTEIQDQALRLKNRVSTARTQNSRFSRARRCSRVNDATKNANVAQADQLYADILSLTATSSLPQANIYACLSVPSGCLSINVDSIETSLNAKASQLENLVSANLGNCAVKTDEGRKTARRARRLVSGLSSDASSLPAPLAQCTLP
jgi:hypothetical protein